MNVRLSAVICTHNRAEYLGKALQSLVDQNLSKDHYEVLVVDNASCDNTRHVFEKFSTVPNLRYLYEPILGLSQARNTGWRHAQGEYIAYLDDDAIAYPQWLEKILEVFDTVEPRPGCVGGKIEPIWEAPRPAWLPDTLLAHLAIQDYSSVPAVLDEPRFLAGANVAYPKHVLVTLGGFHVGLGRRGSSLLSNEEILVRRQLARARYVCFYHPEVAVRHHIQASRLCQSWFIRRMYWQGISESITQVYQMTPSTARRGQWALSAAFRLLRSPRRLIGLLVPTNDPGRFAIKCRTYAQIGYIVGLLGVRWPG